MWDVIKLIVLGVIAVFAAIGANYAHDLAYMVNALTVMLAAGLTFLWQLRSMDDPRRAASRVGIESEYMDGVIRAGVIATAFWGVVGFLVGVVIAAIVRKRQQADVEHRPLDPSVIQCFPPGHPRAGEPIPPAERAPSPSPAERDDPRA